MKIFNSTLFSRKTPALLTAALALIGAGKLGAQTAVSNTAEAFSGSSYVVGYQNGLASSLRQLVFSFTTGASATSFGFTGASVNFGPASGSPGALTFGLFSTFSTGSGTSNQLATLTAFGANQPTSTGLVTFSGSATLAASTTYYLKLAADTSALSNNYTIKETSTNETGLTGWMIGNSSFVFENGAFLSSAGSAPSFSVQASAIPEPSTYAAIAGAAMLGLAVWQRRRRANPAATLTA